MGGAWRGLLAGLLLAVLEIAVVAAHDHALFLSARELERYALLALLALPALGAGLGTALSLGSRLPGMRFAVLALGASVGGWLLWMLTEGRRVRDLPGRFVVVALLALAAGFLLSRLATFVARSVRDGQASRGRVLAFAGLAAVAVILDAVVLRRLYPAFHLGLALVGWIAAFSAVALASPREPDVLRRFSLPVALLLGLIAVTQLNAVAALPGLRFPIEQAAPLTSKLLARWPAKPALPKAAPAAQPLNAPPPEAAIASARATTVDLRDRDVLLITIDALRADRLAAYGATSALAPSMDALAKESRVFLRAYTSTPHTSYALISLLTAKPIGLLYALSSVHEQPVTLPMILRRHGYRTAAFYPPAIFYVDSDRFAALDEQHMGFEYVKAMYAPASQRVDQLREYLAGSDAQHPLFVWVHLFEPHEPYEPTAPFAPTGDATAEQLYDGEVRAADAAVGELIELFRTARPSATVILSADHGEEFGDHGGHHHGTTLFDEQARVPLLWSSPGALEPGPTRAPLNLLDVTTTLLSAFGIPKDARMQGDDLGAVLADPNAPGPAFAFASLPDLAMTTDGVLKLLCAQRTGSCQLFDLEADAGERNDLSGQRPSDVARLRDGWNAFVAEVPRIEALDLNGQAWPAALARARLGDASVTHELIPLLGSPRPEVRSEAARALGELQAAHAKPALARLLETETDPNVAAEVAIAALRLGHPAAMAPALALINTRWNEAIAPLRVREAASALAYAGDCAGAHILASTALESKLAEPDRLAALAALSRCKSVEQSTLTMIALCFGEPRLRVPAADTLAAIGDKRVIPALRQALAKEIYPEARAAEVAALQALGDGKRAERLRKQSELFAATASPAP